MPSCAKPPVDRNQAQAQPLMSTREALLRLGLEVADKRRKRETVPGLPSAIGRHAASVPREG